MKLSLTSVYPIYLFIYEYTLDIISFNYLSHTTVQYKQYIWVKGGTNSITILLNLWNGVTCEWRSIEFVSQILITTQYK